MTLGPIRQTPIITALSVEPGTAERLAAEATLLLFSEAAGGNICTNGCACSDPFLATDDDIPTAGTKTQR